MSNYREQTDYVFRKKTRKAQDQPTELNIQEIDQTEEFSSIPVNETTNSNAGTQNSSIRPKKKPRQKSQVQHSQEIQAQMNTQTQPPQVTHNTDNTQTNQGAINIQKQVVVNNFNCSNTSLSGQSKSQSTNKSEVARKSQNQQNPKQTAPKQVSQTKTPVQKPKEAPQAPLPQETKKTQSQIPLVKPKHTSETSSQSSTVSSGTQASVCNITIEVEAQASELRRHWEDVDPKEYQEQVCCDLVEVIDIYVEDHPKSPISKIQSNLILILKAFFKRKLINRSQCEILLQKIIFTDIVFWSDRDIFRTLYYILTYFIEQSNGKNNLITTFTPNFFPHYFEQQEWYDLVMFHFSYFGQTRYFPHSNARNSKSQYYHKM
ncbi:Hypothetical_protein [Hexamita inflata]|uniref:Hypothetical_protein n=1 Tax=Hexamita inflata TaxID=28002 RepID=A0AA86VKQ5_9EUKA|nr:Hypothetical protein HINF_LOCUS57048 [Hexamita inflata]